MMNLVMGNISLTLNIPSSYLHTISFISHVHGLFGLLPETISIFGLENESFPQQVPRGRYIVDQLGLRFIKFW